MKTTNILLTLLISLFLTKQVLGQCIAFAGNDTFVCAGQYIHLNSASVTGGTPPYSYAWNCPKLISHHTAEDYIEDTTVLNPTIILMPANGPINYWLTVVDAVGDTCRDTIQIRYNAPIVYLSSDTNYISAGDSVELNASIGGSYPPFTYSWEPSPTLSSTDIPNPIAFPDSTTTYRITVTDSLGCALTYQIKIWIIAVGINSVNYNEPPFDLVPNPAENESWLTMDKDSPIEVLLFNMQGSMISSFYLSGKRSRIDTKDLNQGVYFVMVRQDNRAIGIRKLIKL